MKIKSILATIVFGLAQAASAATATAPALTIETLKAQLKSQNANWTAKENYLSKLTPTQLQHRLGLRDDLNPDVEFKAAKGATTQQKAVPTLPTALDWRNKDGQNWISPLLNQANCGSCVAFAAIGVMESQMRIASGLPNYNVRLSTQNLFACGGGACDWGWMPEDAAQHLQQNGVVDEACQPYLSGATGQDYQCTASCADRAQRTHKISGYSTPTRFMKDVEAVKAALQNGPVVTTLTVFMDFLSYSSGIYKHATGASAGGHAVSIVGYNDAEQAFIIRNSWGPEWGEGGFGRVAYSDISGIGNQTWGYQIPAAAGSLFIQSPKDYTFVSETLALEATSTFANTDTLAVSVFNENGQAVLTRTCAADCKDAVDVKALADGRYEIQTQAMDKVGKVLATSTRQSFFVANKQPTITLAFDGNSGTNLKAPLSGRPELAITTTSTAPVPLSSIEFHYKGMGLDKTKGADITLDKMTMGWRTTNVPNGTYEIWMTGHVKTNLYDSQVETPHMTVQVRN